MMNKSFFKESFKVWERDFQLDVSLVCYKGEKVLDSQIRIFHIIKEKYNELFETCKTKIFEYVNDDEQKNLFPDNQIPKNIFKFIMPKAIVITRDIDVDYFGVLFHFRYDPENDICVSFKNFNFYEIGPEYIIL